MGAPRLGHCFVVSFVESTRARAKLYPTDPGGIAGDEESTKLATMHTTKVTMSSDTRNLPKALSSSTRLTAGSVEGKPQAPIPKIYRDTPKDIASVAQLLCQGQLVALPTETVYGLAANAYDVDGCRQIFEIKDRPLIDPFIVHIVDWAQVSLLAHSNPVAEKLSKAFWPGPLTMVLQKKDCVPDIVTAGRPTVALRMPSHPVMRKVLSATDLPLAAPSANPFGYLSPTRVEHVIRNLGHRVEHILDGGPCQFGIESAVVDLSDPTKPALLRLGAIPKEAINACLGSNVTGISNTDTKTGGEGLPSPGMLGKHYSPRATLELFQGEAPAASETKRRTATVFFQRRPQSKNLNAGDCFWLCEDGKAETAARHLFGLLQKLDREEYEVIAVESAPEKGIGAAINDRLRRATEVGDQ